VCPWNRGIEKRRANQVSSEETTAHVDLVDWLERDGRSLLDDFARLYVPRNDERWLRRNALVALGNVGNEEHEPQLQRFAEGDDELLREHAAWALARVRERTR
jgi:epoxyqueuosine reductase